MKQYLGIFIGTILAIAFSVFAFTEPTVAPPGGNVAAPINVSGTAQTKAGDLTVNNFFAKNFSVAPGVSEYNITNVNNVAGFNDLFLKGNSTETAPVYIAGSEIKIYTSSAERLTVTSAGNVGIGTAAPEVKLHVRGGATWGSGLDLDARDVAGGRQWRLASTGGDAEQGQGKLVFYDQSGAYSALTIQGAGAGSGRVGIGTTNPTSRLDVIADFDWPTPTIVARGNIGHPNIQIKSDISGSRDWRIISCGASGCGPAGALRFFDNSVGADRLTILDNGNVGINTTNPSQKLEVIGNVNAVGLCIQGNCKTDWSQVGGSGGFGGMYTLLSVNGGAPFCSISNPKTGGCSCPAGQNDTFIHRSYGPCSSWTCSGGTSYVWDLHMCWQ